MSRFQLILLIVFGAFILVAVLLFSFSRSGTKAGGTLVVWGSLSATDFNQFVSDAQLEADKTYAYQYKEVKSEVLESEFTEALAVGKGPDLIIISEDFVWNNQSKLFIIPSQSVSVETYKKTFIEEGELLLTDTGVYGLPLYMNPMVLYWNRDIFTKAALVKPISYWDEIYAVSQKLSEKDTAGNIVVSTIALGETKNIPHYKEILSLLMLQAGTPITEKDTSGLRSAIANSFNLPVAPGNAALDFYTQFSNQSKPFYTWNRSLLPAQTSFISGDSAMYLGFASELGELKAKNPNLNLGIASVPQSRVSGRATTYGKLYSVAVSRGAKDVGSAVGGALRLVNIDSADTLARISGLPPARRDLLGVRPVDEASVVFYTAAIQSKSWLDPNPVKTKVLFASLVDSITSGRLRTSEAIFKADNDMRVIIEDIK